MPVHRFGTEEEDPTAYGDFIAGILAIVATIALVNRTSWATKSVWLFNMGGAADLLFAFYQGRQVGIQPGMLERRSLS